MFVCVCVFFIMQNMWHLLQNNKFHLLLILSGTYNRLCEVITHLHKYVITLSRDNEDPHNRKMAFDFSSYFPFSLSLGQTKMSLSRNLKIPLESILCSRIIGFPGKDLEHNFSLQTPLLILDLFFSFFF